MNVLERYIATAVLKGVLIVLLVLVAVGTFVEFVGELNDVGTGEYGIESAASYVALRLPRMIFQMLPAAALLGALLSLGNLAVHRELIVMRSSGMSHWQLASAVGSAGIALMLLMVLLGESLGPSLGAYAREFRARALHEELDVADGQSTWLRNGDRILSLRQPSAELDFGGVLLFELGEQHSLQEVARADSADIDAESRWVLVNYAETRFSDDGVEAARQPLVRQDYDLSLDLLGLSVVREDLLDTPALQRYIRFLQQNDLDASRYLLAYWDRIADVVSVLLMTVLALPFVVGSLRSAGAGARLLVGLIVGLGYYVAGEAVLSSGQVFELDPVIVAWAPTAVLLVVTMIAFSRMR